MCLDLSRITLSATRLAAIFDVRKPGSRTRLERVARRHCGFAQLADVSGWWVGCAARRLEPCETWCGASRRCRMERLAGAERWILPCKSGVSRDTGRAEAAMPA